MNLLNNAAKYSENEGHIQLSACNDEGEVVIIVRDRGVGIPPEKLAGMFELFAQGDRSLARSEGGLGIGLTVVKKLVEMHGGTVDGQERRPGQGKRVYDPASGGIATGRARSTRLRISARAPNRKARILVVDDNVDTAQGMVRLLSLIGHETASGSRRQRSPRVAANSGRSSSCSTSGYPAWTATRSPPGCGGKSAARMRSSSRSRATARTKTAAGRQRWALTITSSSRSTTTPCCR